MSYRYVEKILKICEIQDIKKIKNELWELAHNIYKENYKTYIKNGEVLRSKKEKLDLNKI